MGYVIITVYFTDSVKKGDVLWEKKYKYGTIRKAFYNIVVRGAGSS